MQQTELTWDSLLRTLSKQWGDDIAQDVLTSYLKNNTEIRHGIRYFRKCAKNARLMQRRKPAQRQVWVELPPAIRVTAQQLTRVLLSEVWDTLTAEQRDRFISGLVGPSESVSKSSTARVRMYRLRRKLQNK